MRYITLGVLLFLCATIVKAQVTPLGDIPEDILTMTSYPADTTTNAFVLFDIGSYIYNYSYYKSNVEYDFKRRQRIKIFNEDAFYYATKEVRLYVAKKSQKLESIKAYTVNINENGKIVKTELNKKDIIEEKISKNVRLYKFTMPNLQKGSVIDIEYHIVNSHAVYIPNWRFQWSIPVEYSEYSYAIPDWYTFDTEIKGYFFLDERQSIPFIDNGQFRVRRALIEVEFTGYEHRLVASHLPAFKSEPFMTTANDYIGQIKFHLRKFQFENNIATDIITNWDDAVRKHNTSSSFGKKLKSNRKIRKLVTEHTNESMDDMAKLKALYDYVINNVSWNNISSINASNSLNKVLKEKKGSSAELALLLTQMLQDAGLSAYPVILSTRLMVKLIKISPQLASLTIPLFV